MSGRRTEDGRGRAAVGAGGIDSAGDVCEGRVVVVDMSGRGIRQRTAVARDGLGKTIHVEIRRGGGVWERVGSPAEGSWLGAVAVSVAICTALSLSLNLGGGWEELREARAGRASHRGDALFLSPPPCSNHDIFRVAACGRDGAVCLGRRSWWARALTLMVGEKEADLTRGSKLHATGPGWQRKAAVRHPQALRQGGSRDDGAWRAAERERPARAQERKMRRPKAISRPQSEREIG